MSVRIIQGDCRDVLLTLEYAGMAERRISNDAGLFAQVAAE